MRTRCPECGTVFRVTSEQLRRKAGKVRCGHCQVVFNAFDHWQSDTDQSAATLSVPQADSPAPEEAVSGLSATTAAESVRQVAEPLEHLPSAAEETPEDWLPEHEIALEPVEPALSQALDGELPLADDEPEPVFVPEAVPASGTAPALPVAENLPGVSFESPEESTLAAREAGLVAARDLTETAAYNRWAAGTLTGDGLGGFGGEPLRRAVWPFVLVSSLLFVVLLGQLFYYFRAEIALRVPSSTTLYQLVGADIPLPRDPALVSIETSDLQSDNARGLFVLQATLKNRASYAQAWPALELSLTDTNDTVVSRRVMSAAEYLPPGTTDDAFPANGEVAVKLWLEAKNIGASGYRLYLFYP